MISRIITYIISFLFIFGGYCLYTDKINIKLGLDLKGGNEFLIKVDAKEYIAAKLKENARKFKTMTSSMTILSDKIEFTSQKNFDVLEPFLKSINLSCEKIHDDHYVATIDNIDEIKKNLMQSSIETIKNRIDSTGTQDISVVQQGHDLILLSIPNKIDEQYLNDVLSIKAKLSFHFVTEENNVNAKKLKMRNSDQYIFINSYEHISGANLINANPILDSYGSPAISIAFDKEGAEIFSFMTRKTGKKIAIVLDDEVITVASVNVHIVSGSAMITGSMSIEETSKISLFLKSGSMKADFTILQKTMTGPTIGQEAIQNSFLTSILSALAVSAFMIGYYGWFLGFIAVITILITILIILVSMALFGITMTLFGIGGLIATIGMCVDANVIIFENILDEQRSKNRMRCIERGFNNAWITILDSNLTTIIAALGLFIFGTTEIKGFAITLIIGIIGSIFSAVYLAKELMVQFKKYFI